MLIDLFNKYELFKQVFDARQRISNIQMLYSECVQLFEIKINIDDFVYTDADADFEPEICIYDKKIINITDLFAEFVIYLASMK